jgi:hypothetical protein
MSKITRARLQAAGEEDLYKKIQQKQKVKLKVI